MPASKRTLTDGTRRVSAEGAQDTAPLHPVSAVQLYQQITDRIEEQIRAGVWKPGDRLPSERELAKLLRVSRPSLREALGALQVSGVVQTRPGSGSYVNTDAVTVLDTRRPLLASKGPLGADISPIALLEARQFLDGAVAAAAAARRRADAVAEALIERMRTVRDPVNPDQRVAWSDADRMFHSRLGHMTANPVLAHFCDYVSVVMDQPLWRRLRDDALALPGHLEQYADDHERIYRAIVDGDVESSTFYATQHVRSVRRDMGLE
jgi:DNA-binding FadR family transcriptional regulator